jgi:hypothetical protein
MLDTITLHKYLAESESKMSGKIPDYDPSNPSNTMEDFQSEGSDPWGVKSKPKRTPAREKAGAEEFDVGGILVTETEKAYGVKVQTTGIDDDSLGGDPEEISWLPKSLAIPCGEDGGYSFFTIPIWLAKKKGFCE